MGKRCLSPSLIQSSMVSVAGDHSKPVPTHRNALETFSLETQSDQSTRRVWVVGGVDSLGLSDRWEKC